MNSIPDETLERTVLHLLEQLAQQGCMVLLRKGQVMLNEWHDRPVSDAIRAQVHLYEHAIVSILQRNGGVFGPYVRCSTNLEKRFPMTDLQRAYYVGERYFDTLKTPAYIATGYKLPNGSGSRVCAALQSLLTRHPMLRARVVDIDYQEIGPEDSCDFVYIETTDLDCEALEKRFEDESRDIWRRLPSLECGPQLTAVLLEGATSSRLILGVRLFVLDADAISLLYREIEKLLRDPSALPPSMPITFPDFVLALTQYRKTQKYRNSVAYWTRRLATISSAPELPMMHCHSRLAHSHFTRRRFRVKREQWAQIQIRARNAGLTLNAVLFTCYTDVLRKWSTNKSFSVTLLVSMRATNQAAAELSTIIGNFGTTTLITSDGDGDTFLERARSIQDQMLSVLPHTQVSAIEVLQMHRNGGGEIIQNIPYVFASGLGGKEKSPHYAQVDDWTLTFQGMQTPQVLLDHQVFEENDELICNFDYISEAFPPGLIDDFSDSYQEFVYRLSADEIEWAQALSPSPPIQSLAARCAANLTCKPITPRSLCSALRDMCQMQPDALAMIGMDESLTYRDVQQRIAVLIAQLRDYGVSQGSIVGIFARKSTSQYIAAAAVAWMGATYLPLNVEWPKARLYRFVEHCNTKLIIAEERDVERLPNLPIGVEFITISKYSTVNDIESLPEPASNPDEIAYIIFTSGSTGTPKATAVSHRSAWNTIEDILHRFEFSTQDRVLALSELSFDLSVFDLFGTFAAGGTVLVPSATATPSPEHWVDIVQRHKVTVWNSVPMLMEMALDSLGTRATTVLNSLRLVMLSGDWIPVDLPRRIQEAIPGIRVIALGGATEASIWSNYHEVTEIPSTWDSIPYGRPLANQRFYILDEEFALVPNWVPGELYIAGNGVCEGYYRQPELTEQAFFTPPSIKERVYRTGDYGRYWPDGTIEFLGRRDAQVKVRGFRLDLREIESNLMRHPSVQQAACLVDGEGAHCTLIAFIVPRNNTCIEPSTLSAILSVDLPPYAIPDRFVTIAQLPLTPNGKRDIRGLLEYLPTTLSTDELEGLSPSERRLQKLWASVCGVEAESIDADFFASGGNSILSVRLVHELNKITGVNLPPSSIFEHRTLRTQAQLLNAFSSTSVSRSLVELRHGNDQPLVILVHPVGGTLYGYKHLIRALNHDWTIYGFENSSTSTIPSSLSELAAQYVEELRRIDRPYHLIGWSMGGIVSLEIARHLFATQLYPQSITLIDSYASSSTANESLSIQQSMTAFIQDYLAGQGKQVLIPSPKNDATFLQYVNSLKHFGYLPTDLPAQEFEQIFYCFEALYSLLLNHVISPVSFENVLYLKATQPKQPLLNGLVPIEILLHVPSGRQHSLDFDHHTIMSSDATVQLIQYIEHHILSHTSMNENDGAPAQTRLSMQDQDRIFMQIAEIVQQSVSKLDIALLNRSTVLEEIGINSMKRIHIIGCIERTFNIEFEVDELISEQLNTLGGFCDCVVEKTALATNTSTEETQKC